VEFGWILALCLKKPAGSDLGSFLIIFLMIFLMIFSILIFSMKILHFLMTNINDLIDDFLRLNLNDS